MYIFFLGVVPFIVLCLLGIECLRYHRPRIYKKLYKDADVFTIPLRAMPTAKPVIPAQQSTTTREPDYVPYDYSSVWD